MSKQSKETTAQTGQPRRHRGYWVIGIILVLSLVLGVIAFRNMKRSIASIDQSQKQIAIDGKKLSLNGCIDRVVQWKKDCGAIHVLCRASISRLTALCLEAQPRKQACQALDLGKSRAHFSYTHCKARGLLHRHWKRECGAAYGTLWRYCRYWQDKAAKRKTPAKSR